MEKEAFQKSQLKQSRGTLAIIVLPPTIKTLLMKQLILFFSFLLLLSCEQKTKENKHTKSRLFKNTDTIYKRNWINLVLSKNKNQELEFYISNKNDTILNQYKTYKNNNLDTLNSEFYELKINKTSKHNTYKGKIIFHSKFDNFIRNKNQRVSLEFSYWQKNLDSVFMTTIKTNTKNEIDFEYINIKENKLTGLLIVFAENDTIINNEKMTRIRQIYKAVDNQIQTKNGFIHSFELDKKNKMNGKLKITEVK